MGCYSFIFGKQGQVQALSDKVKKLSEDMSNKFDSQVAMSLTAVTESAEKAATNSANVAVDLAVPQEERINMVWLQPDFIIIS